MARKPDRRQGVLNLPLSRLWFLGVLLGIWFAAAGLLISSKGLGSGLLLAFVLAAAVPVVALGFWLVVFVPPLLIHELGHWLAGRFAGYALYEFRVWPVAWIRLPKPKLEIRWARQPHEPMAYVRMFPVSGLGSRSSFATLIAGGPIASLGLLALCLTPVGIFGPMALLIAYFPAVVFLASLWPAKKGAFRTDGALLLAILRDPVRELAVQAAGKRSYLAAIGEATNGPTERPQS